MWFDLNWEPLVGEEIGGAPEHLDASICLLLLDVADNLENQTVWVPDGMYRFDSLYLIEVMVALRQSLSLRGNIAIVEAPVIDAKLLQKLKVHLIWKEMMCEKF